MFLFIYNIYKARHSQLNMLRSVINKINTAGNKRMVLKENNTMYTFKHGNNKNTICSANY